MQPEDVITKPVKDMTSEELFMVIRTIVVETLQEQTHVRQQKRDQRAILDIPPLSVGEWSDGLNLLRREDYDDDDGR